jgi:LmbE family N-acetylglucosaminyl deacetylase
MREEKDHTGRVLLAVLAHPDDESFGMGGTLAYYAQQGAQVYLVCATQGEAGEVAPQFLEGFASVAERRVSELRCAAGILGLAGVYYLGYRDSGMSGSEANRHPQALVNASLEDIAAKVSTYIRRLRPQVIVTFDPIGGYMHPDHIAIQRAATRAFDLAGDPDYIDPESLPPYQPAKLYYHIMPKGAFCLAVLIMPLLGRDPHKFGRNQDIDIVELVEKGNFPTHAVIDYRPVWEKRDAAAACHASQLDGGTPRSGFWGFLFRLMGGKEQYMRARPEVTNGHKENDLFEGI